MVKWFLTLWVLGEDRRVREGGEYRGNQRLGAR